jgi:hypothetical protein
MIEDTAMKYASWDEMFKIDGNDQNRSGKP